MIPAGLEGLTPEQVLGLTGAGEARSILIPGHGWQPAGLDTMIAVMWTPVHRVAVDPARFGADVTATCFWPKQYSCWNPGSGSNHDWVVAQGLAVAKGLYVAPIVRMCISAAEGILSGSGVDSVNFATHYYSPVSMVPPGRVPTWAVGVEPCAKVGEHLFFKGV